MHLRSISLKGFKSFPDRTTLEFGPGVSVIVGPNGSGKSNITDAVLWAMGEQSPLAVRGQAMQDVIFAGGHGQHERSEAEVEIVIDNADGGLGVEFTEVSILRRLDRASDGEYRLNGARCRLVDVLEVLSDTGLGREGHSVVSQGRVEAVVTSKPRDRRLLIEEAAGLGKHRKRRRRAQLKLGRTHENLARALDVEQEARSRLRPLKRQAEAAELHARLERQTLEARYALVRDGVRERVAARDEAVEQAVAARAAREQAAVALAEEARRREQAEDALAQRGERRDALAARAYAARSASERVGLRLEDVRATDGALQERIARTQAALEQGESAGAAEDPGLVADGGERIAALESELAALRQRRQLERQREVSELETARTRAVEALASHEEQVTEHQRLLEHAEHAAQAARERRRDAERGAEAARRRAAAVGATLAVLEESLRAQVGAGPQGQHPTLGDELRVRPGCELAVAAVLGGRLSAALVADRRAGGALLDAAGANGGTALVAAGAASSQATMRASGSHDRPTPAAEPLAALLSGPVQVLALVRALLADAWLVDDLDGLPSSFAGVAVTTAGRVWAAGSGELRQAPAGGADRLLAERNRREALIVDREAAMATERAALADVERATAAVEETDASRQRFEEGLRAARRERDDADEAVRGAERRIAARGAATEHGPEGDRRTQLEAELAAEQRAREVVERERRARAERQRGLNLLLERDQALLPAIQRLASALAAVSEALAQRRATLERELVADRQAGEALAAELRACAQRETELQAELGGRADLLMATEVRTQQLRDRAGEAEQELSELAGALGLPSEPAAVALEEAERQSLEQRILRLARRREQLGPVNPLAADEYADALAHVEELERQRADLESALSELRRLIADTDREIRETFEATFAATARHFEEVVNRLFPGGRGQLRLVQEDGQGSGGPRRILGAEAIDGQARESGGLADDEDGEDREQAGEDATPEDRVGVELEITPAGKSMKRLSLLSGGEKSLTALAFLFSVFLARPCPFYILDEVEAALDDINIDRFLDLLRSYSSRAQFIVVTHQRRTMEVADWLYGVSMGGDGVSRVVSRRLEADREPPAVAGAA